MKKKDLSGLHTVKNSRKKCVVKKRRGQCARLTVKKRSRLKKTAIVLCALLIVCGAAFGIGSLSQPPAFNNVDLGFVTVSYEPPKDGSKPDMHDALENIGYMKYRLQHQTSWYAEMHGDVDTILKQQVSTYKQFENGVLIQTDISTSSLVNSARQFCYSGDSVMWRLAAGNSSSWATSYDDLATMQWKGGEPYGHMSVADFTEANGLPGTEFSVYVINEQTLVGADPVVDHGDGTYSQTYYLNPATDKAPCHYVNQMVSTGGLSSLPAFEYITVTYTFDSTWQILSSDVKEAYNATMGFSVNCVATYHTDYHYNTEKSQATAYEEYFKDYVGSDMTGVSGKTDPTVVDCLAGSFASVLTQPTIFDVSLSLNGKKVDGSVYLDLNKSDIRAKFGGLSVWYDGDSAYLSYADYRIRLDVESLLALFQGNSTGAGISLDMDALLQDLAAGEFTFDEDSASLVTNLNLAGIEIPLSFEFSLDEKNNASLKVVETEIALGDFAIGAALSFGKDAPPAFVEAEKDTYIDIVPYIGTLKTLFESEYYAIEIAYAGDGFAVDGAITLDVANLTAAGKLELKYHDITKVITLIYKDNVLYVELDGLKIKGSVEEIVALVGEYVTIETGSLDAAALIEQILSLNFGELIALSESENTLEVLFKGTELLQALGIDFALGDVQLEVSDKKLSASVLGAQAIITRGEAFEVTTDGYVDIVGYAKNLIGLFTSEYLTVTVSYAGEVSVDGAITLDIANLTAAGKLELKYHDITKNISLIYKENVLYVELDGLKIKGSIEEIVALVGEYVTIETGSLDAATLIEQVLSLNFGQLITLSEADNTLQVLVKGTELLKALGIDFALGEVKLEVSDNKLSVSVLGAEAVISRGEAFEVVTDGYVDIVGYAKNLIDLFTSEYLTVTVAYAGEVSVGGAITLDVANLTAAGKLELKYHDITKVISLIYKDNVLYVELDGLKIKGSIEEIVALVGEYVTIETGSLDAAALIEQVLSLNFGELIALSETDSTLQVLVKGTELLKALGIDFALGDVKLEVADNKLSASVLGAEAIITRGEAFEVTTDGYIDIVGYAKNLIDLFTSEYLTVTVSYAGEVSVNGAITVDVANLTAAGKLELKYHDITKVISLIYKDNVLYVELDGLKIKGSVEEIVSLVGEYVTIESGSLDAAALIEQVLSLNFGELIALSETENTLQVLVKGTELLKALGIDFALGDVKLEVSDNKLSASVLGAEAVITCGEAFEIVTDGYIDIVGYAKNLIDLFASEYLTVTVSYAGEVSVGGVITVDATNLTAAGNLKLTYHEITKDISLIYKENVLYVELDGLKIKGSIEEIVALVGEYVTIETGNLDAAALIEQILSLNFGELITLSETDNTLQVLVKGTELLKALGIDFALGDVNLEVSDNKLSASVLGAEAIIMRGEAFEVTTDGYIDIVGYAKNLIDLFTSEYLTVTVSYAGEVSISGAITVDVANLTAAGKLNLTYHDITKVISLIYKDNVLYVELDGLKIKGSIEEIVALVGEYVTIETGSLDAAALIEQVLSLNFGELITLSKADNTLQVLVKGTELLKALGIDFALGDVKLEVADNKLSVSVLGAEAVITRGEAFEVTTDGYIDIVGYAKNLIDLFTSEYLTVTVSYAGEVSVGGAITVDVANLTAAGELKLNYHDITKDISLIYKENVLYVELDGLKIKGSVEGIVSLVGEYVTIETGSLDAAALIEQVLSLNFGQLIALQETDSTLQVLVKGTELLKALGIDFALGDVKLEVSDNKLSASVLGAQAIITRGEAFEVVTDGYVDIVGYVKNLIDLFTSEYLTVTVSYAGEVSISGAITVDVANLTAAGELKLTYHDITKIISLIYKDNVLYVELDGLKIKGSVEEIVALVGEYVTIESGSIDAAALIEQVLSLNFGELITLSESENTLAILVKGTELLKALGIDFALGDVKLEVSDNKLSASVLGAEAIITRGEAFEVTTDGYIDIVGYAKDLIDLFTSEYLTITVSYAAEVSVNGAITVDVANLTAAGKLNLTYHDIAKTISLIYKENVLYVELDGLKVKGSIEEIVALVGEYVTIESGNLDAAALIEQVLSLNFGELIALSETDNTLEILVKGTELLKALGIDFALGDVNIEVSDNKLSASVLGAEAVITRGEAFEVTTDGYIDIVGYAKNLIDLFTSEYLTVTVSYAGEVSISGAITLDVANLTAAGKLELKYHDITKTISLIYKENVLYVELDGLKIKGSVEEIVSLVGEYVTIETGNLDAAALIEQVLSLNFGQLITLSEADSTLQVFVKGTELLKALGIEFALGDVKLEVADNKLSASVLGAEAIITRGEAFEVTTDGYIDIVGYAKNLIDLFTSEYLTVTVSYAGEVSISGAITLDVANLTAAGKLELKYHDITKNISLIYKDNVLYVELDGLKIKGSIEEIVALVGEYVTIESGSIDAAAMIEQVLSLNLGDLIALSETENTLQVLVKGTELLKALGIDFALGDVKLEVSDNKLSASVLGAEAVITRGEAFEVTTDGYVDIIGYAKNLIDLFTSEYLTVTVSYAGEVSVGGAITLDVANLTAAGKLELKYHDITKAISLIYKENVLYIELDGLKIKGSVEEIVALVGEYVTIETGSLDAAALIEQVLSLNLGQLITLSETDSTLQVLVKGTELLKALGIDFALGDVKLEVSDNKLSASVLGAEAIITRGEAFEVVTDGYIDIVGYAKNLIDLFTSEYLTVTVSYAGEVSVGGAITLDVANLTAAGKLELKYHDITKNISLIYKENVLYVELDGLKVKGSIEEIVALVGEYVTIETGSLDAAALIEQILSLNFGQLIALQETDSTLQVLVKGTELLKALGIDFALGDVKLEVSDNKLSASVLGAQAIITRGEAFEVTTDGYIDIVGYAKNLIDLFTSEYLTITVSYAGEVAVDGAITINVANLTAAGKLELKYHDITKVISLIYKENVLYVQLDGLKIKGSIEEIVALVGEYVTIESGSIDAAALIEQVLSLNFGELITLSEADSTLQVFVKGTELLKALGIDFALGDVILEVSDNKLSASVLGAQAIITRGEAFEVTTDGYIDIVGYAKNLIDLFTSEYLTVTVSYAGEVSISGAITVDVANLTAVGKLELKYHDIIKDISLIYKENVLYVEIDGLKIKGSIEEIVALVGEYVTIESGSIDAAALIEQVLSLNFGELITLSESDSTLQVLVKGTELLKALGIDFALGDVKLEVSDNKLSASVLGAEAVITRGEAFEVTTDGYIDIVGYAKNLIDLFTSEYLTVTVSYAGEVSVNGAITVDVANLTAAGKLELKYHDITKVISLIYKDNVLYVELDGLKIKGSIEEIVALVGEYVTIETGSIDAAALIEQVLSLNFGQLITLSETDNTLEVLVKGTELLQALGIDFALGDVKLEVADNKLSASVLGAEAVITRGEAFEVTTDGYIDIVGYAKNLIDLFTSEYLTVTVSYAGEVAVDGAITINVANLTAAGKLNLTYHDIAKTISLIYKENVLYVELDGLKVKGSIEEIVALVGEYVTIESGNLDAAALIEQVLSLNFGELITLSETENTLQVLVKGTELLQALGIDFALGDVKLEVSDNKLSASVLGAEAVITRGEAFEVTTDGYVDIVGYAKNLIDLFTSEYLTVTVSYAGEVSVNGAITLDVANLTAAGKLELKYHDVAKVISLIYKDNVLYVELDGLKIKGSIEEIVALVGEYVTIETGSLDAAALIEQVLSLNLGQLITIQESDNTLQVLVKGTELLKALGIDFALGDVKLEVSDNKLSASVLGAESVITRGESFEVVTDGYIDIVGYAKNLIDLFTSEYLTVTVSYAGEVSVNGAITLDVANLTAAGELKVTYYDITKVISLIYKDNVLYVELDGLKIKGSIEEIVALVGKYVTIETGSLDAAALIEQVLSLNFGQLIALSETDNSTLQVLIKGTELLQALGIDFALGEVKLEVSDNKLSASVLGAEAVISRGEAFEVVTDGYVDIVGYAKNLIDLFTSEYLTITVSYAGEVAVDGAITLDVANLTAAGELKLNYHDITKVISLIYKDNVLYVELDGLKIKGSVEEIVALVGEYVTIETGSLDAAALIEQVLSLNFGQLITLSETDSTLQVLIKGTELLKALEIDFALGGVKLEVSDSGLSLGAADIGIQATIAASSAAPTIGDLNDYTSITPYVNYLAKMISGGYLMLEAVFASGDLTVEATINLDIQKKIAAGEFAILYKDITIAIPVIYQDGVIYAELYGLKIKGAVKEIVAFVGQYITIESGNVDTSKLLEQALALSFGQYIALSEGENVLDILVHGTELLQGLGVEFNLGEVELSVSQDKLTASVLGIAVTVTSIDAFEAVTDGYADVLQGLQYLMDLITADNVTYTVTGEVYSAEGKYADVGGLKYNVTAKLEYYSGGSFPVHLDLTEGSRNFWLNTDMYAHIFFEAKATKESDDSIVCDMSLLDCDLNGEQDGVLDLYVSVSRVATDKAEHAPLNFYITMNDFASLIAVGSAMLGDDIALLKSEFVQEILIEKWLSPTTTEQLSALGSSLLRTIGVSEMLKNIFSAAGDTAGSVIHSESPLFKSVIFGKDENENKTVTATLSSEILYGEDMGSDVTVTFTEGKQADGSGYLAGIALENVYFDAKKSGMINLSLAADLSPVAIPGAITFEGNYYNLTGVIELLKTLANSATHEKAASEVMTGEEAQHEYVLNENFYIDGSVSLNLKVLSLFKVNASVDVVAISVNVDENGEIGINIRLEYQGVQEANQVAINGDSTVDITIKGGMVYIRRVQTSQWKTGLITSEEQLTTPITVYRAMPLNVFFADIIKQLGFVLNFGDLITQILPDQTEGFSFGESDDFGTMASSILSGFEYKQNADDTQTWVVKLNGGALTNGVMKDIVVTLNSAVADDGTQIIRALGVDTGIIVSENVSSGVVDIALTGNLTFRNPRGVMDAGTTDRTNDISEILQNAMQAAIDKANAAAWLDENGKYLFVEGQLTTIYYVLAGKTQPIGEQAVLFDPETHELFANLVFPDLSDYQVDGYTLEWDTDGLINENGAPTVSANQKIYASYHGKTYTLTLVSQYAAEGWTYDETAKVYRITLDYVYGTELNLPFAADEYRKIVSFADENGREYAKEEILSDLTLHAQWEEIEYTVVYMVDGAAYTQTAHYGDALEFPEARKDGYQFVGWDIADTTVSGNKTYTAQFTPNTYHITLVSEHELEGFTFDDATQTWRSTLDYVYDSSAPLPNGIKTNRYFLDGFVFDGETQFYTAVPNTVLSDVTMYAKWSDIAYTIKFVANGKDVATQNYNYGDTLNLPEVPQDKTGYTGRWNVPENYTVTGDDSIEAVYTANTYAVSLVSGVAVDGYTAQGELFVKEIEYTYDTAAVELDASVKVACYNFGGYFTSENGEGTQYTEILNITSDLTLYLYWIDNTVTVKLFSDIEFEGYEARDQVLGYYKTVSFNDDYALTETLTATGYQQLGWWHCDESGTWKLVDNVSELDGENIRAVWIQNIEAELTEFSNGTGGGFSTYSMAGAVQGGQVYGSHSTEIISAIGATQKQEGVYWIYSSDGKVDELENNNAFVITYNSEGIGTFKSSGMTSWNSFTWGGAAYGGVVITVTYSYGSDLSVSTSNGCIVSFNTYNVKFTDDTGNTLQETSVRLDCPFDDYDSATYLSEIAPKLEDRDYYNASWNTALSTAVTGDMTVTAVYTPKLYPVKLISEAEIEGWDCDEKGQYVYHVNMDYGAKIKITDCNKKVTETTVGAEGVELTLPEFVGGGWQWNANISNVSAEISAVRTPDKIVYQSDVVYTLNGASYGGVGGDYTYSFDNDYTLFNSEVSSEGYTFLGWFTSGDGGWSKVESLTYSEGNRVETTVQALWISDLKVDVSNVTRTVNGRLFKSYSYSGSISISGGELIGAFANEIKKDTATESFNFDKNDTSREKYKATADTQFKMTIEYYFNDKGDMSSGGHGKSRGVTVYHKSQSTNEVVSENKKYLCVDVTVSYAFKLADGTLFVVNPVLAQAKKGE